MEITGTLAVKAILRQEIRRLQSEQSDAERQTSDQALFDAFLQLPQVEQAQTMLLFYGVGYEPATSALLETLLAQGKTICLPRCLPDHQMEARQISCLQGLIPSSYGIPEPSEACPVLPKEQLDLILVPALCCDWNGFRLGQGGGYYDRYLDEYKGFTVSFCRDDYVQSMLPRELHDRPVRLVLTEDGPARPS